MEDDKLQAICNVLAKEYVAKPARKGCLKGATIATVAFLGIGTIVSLLGSYEQKRSHTEQYAIDSIYNARIDSMYKDLARTHAITDSIFYARRDSMKKGYRGR